MQVVDLKRKFRVSRNALGVPRRNQRRCIVLHATAGTTLAGALSTLYEAKLGYHYLIDRQGVIFKGAATQHVVAHAGTSIGPLGEGANSYSIGISFVNKNDGIDEYTSAQYASAQWLIDELCRANPSIAWITTHRAISLRARNRRTGKISGKTDPRAFKTRKLNLPDGVNWWDGNSWGLV